MTDDLMVPLEDEQEAEGVLLCSCGNTEVDGTFTPCTESGKDVPITEQWKARHYRCDRCGNVLDGLTGEVLGGRP